MDMTLSSCWDCGPGAFEYAVFVILVFFAPVGAFVLRKHIASARGIAKAAGTSLQAIALLSLPLAVLMLLSIVTW